MFYVITTYQPDSSSLLSLDGYPTQEAAREAIRWQTQGGFPADAYAVAVIVKRDGTTSFMTPGPGDAVKFFPGKGPFTGEAFAAFCERVGYFHRDAALRALRLGYEIEEDDGRFNYVRPNGEQDSEEFAYAGDAWEAAESDAGLWEADHGAGIDALETLEACRAVLEAVNGNSEPESMADGLGRLAALLAGKPDPGPARALTWEESQADGWRIESHAGRFYAYNPEGMETGPNPGFATEAQAQDAARAWAASARIELEG